MRFSRDKRGYENTFVVHTGGSRRRGKPRSRILYWFRTPPGVRVGRSALDEEAIRLIEEHNPDVEFDWTRILKGQEAAAPSAPSPHKERRARERPPRESRPVPAAAPEPPPVRPSVEPAYEEPPEQLESSAIEHSSSTAAETKLGTEGLARLRARHAATLARISEAVTDPVRREELKARAERLNPDTWVTDAEVAAGLESYEAVFESLRAVVGRRRKRRRSRRGARPDRTAAPTASADEPDDDETPEPDAG